MTVFFVDWETMVTIPGVKDCFLFNMGDRPSLVERGLGVKVSRVACALRAWNPTVRRGYKTANNVVVV